MPSPRALYQIGTLILICGILGAGAIYWRAQIREAKMPDATQVESDDTSLSPEDSKRYAYGVEKDLGKLGLLMSKFLRLGGQLTHGKPLAFTVAFVSIGAAVGCFVIADRLSVP